MKALILGAGGHGRVVAEALRAALAAGRLKGALVGFIDAAFAIGDTIDGYAALGGDDDLERQRAEGVDTGFLGIGGIRGGGDLRRRLLDRLLTAGFDAPPLVHPSAVVASNAYLGDGAVVLAGAIVGVGARVGRAAIINTRASVDHDCRIADGAHIAPGATLSGGVEVGPDAMIGVGACVIQGKRIGACATVGAGAVVIADVEAAACVVGAPARPLRTESK